MNKPAEVKWKPLKANMHRQTWREGKPASEPPAENAPDMDVYSVERASLWERMHKVLGRGGVWRDPREPVSHGEGAREQVEATLLHALAAARNWQGRRERAPAGQWTVRDEIACRVIDAQDVGPDVLMSLLFSRPVNGSNIVRHMARALVDFKPKLARVMPETLSDGAWAVLMAQVHGRAVKRPHSMRWEDWQTVQDRGEKLLWQSAEQTLKGIAAMLE